MVIACWSVKGGSGTTVIATTLALMAARGGREALVVDLGGDVPAALGIPEPDSGGVRAWCETGACSAASLAPFVVPVAPRLTLVTAGGLAERPASALEGERLCAALGSIPFTIVDCGPPGSPASVAVAGAATRSLLVMRPCYLAFRRALAAPIRPSGVILLVEDGRSLGARDVEDVLGVPVITTVPVDATVARAVDAGVLAGRVPRPLEWALRQAA